MRAVEAAKRSTTYREIRHQLGGAAPCDVWAENGIYVVLFSASTTDDSERFIGFAIERQRYKVITSGALSLDVSENGWRVRHRAASLTQSE